MGSVTVRNIGKKFKRYGRRWHRLLEWGSNGRLRRHEEHWAVRGVSFQVNRGEAVGIVGQNGAGKSTLLKIITGTTQSTEGEVVVDGRLAAILELGMGFHPEFTGRENAVMGLQVLGLSADQIRTALTEVIDFSELDHHMDQPIRTYSSGMHMRLAFSVATAIKPEILIVDEALSVGDAYFQHKSIHKIREFRDLGTTLLFVSHDPAAVKTLCRRALLLDQGLMIRDGSPDAVLDYYNAMIAHKEEEANIRQRALGESGCSTRSGSGEAQIHSVEIIDNEGRSANAFRQNEAVRIVCRVQFSQPLEDPTVGFVIRDRLGNDVFGTNTYHLGAVSKSPIYTGDIFDVTFTTVLNLGIATYSLSVAVHLGQNHTEGNYDWWDRVVVFQVLPTESFQFVGTAFLPSSANWKRVDSPHQPQEAFARTL